MEILGNVIGESTIQEATFLTDKQVRLGLYVVIEDSDRQILGLIKDVTTGSPMLDESITDVELVKGIKNVDPNVPSTYTRVSVKLLYDLRNNSRPYIPPQPGTPVRLATEDELRKIFSQGDLEKGYITIGKLVGTNVEVKVNAQALTRHLAILAATGSGKSNTVAVLSTRLSQAGLTTLIFDYHGEYSKIEDAVKISPKLNPVSLTSEEFATILGIRKRQAPIQYRISNLANYLLGIKEISTADVTITRSIEREVRKRIYCEEVKEKKCIGKIYGRPDFMIDGIPGEIKATSSNNEAELLRKGIVQAGLYAWLYNKNMAYSIMARYKMIDSETAIPLSHTRYIVYRPFFVSKEKLEAICERIKPISILAGEIQ